MITTTVLSTFTRCSRVQRVLCKPAQQYIIRSFRIVSGTSSCHGIDHGFSSRQLGNLPDHLGNQRVGILSQIQRFASSENKPDTPKTENIWTIPNLLTGSRIALTPVLGNLVLTEQFPMAAGLFFLAGFTDMLDGQIARAWPSQRSMFGTILDPLADKFLISTLTITLTVVNLIPLWLTALIVARDVGLICASFWVRYISMDSPITLSRFFNVRNATVEFKPTAISKANTVFQLGLVMASIGAPILDFVGHPLLEASWYVTGLTTVMSGLSYIIWRTDTYKVLKSGRKK